jgi:Flp pilus assembly protein TadG
MTPSGLQTRFLSFGRAEAGSATVEFTLWVPVFLGILLLGADASAAFTQQANFWRVTNETARIVSRHALDAEGGAAFARDKMRIGNYVPTVKVTVDDATQIVTVSVTADAEQLAPLGILSFALDDTVSFSVSQALEPI